MMQLTGDYAPTLGGLRVAQKFLERHGFSLPTFQMNFCLRGSGAQARRIFDQGWVNVQLIGAVTKYGPTHEVRDVQFVDDSGRFVRLLVGNSVILESSGEPGDLLFDFISSYQGNVFLNVARWGKEVPAGQDWANLRFFPERYEEEFLKL